MCGQTGEHANATPAISQSVLYVSSTSTSRIALKLFWTTVYRKVNETNKAACSRRFDPRRHRASPRPGLEEHRPHSLYRLLSMPNEAEAADRKIGFAWQYAAGPPDFEEYFEERQDQYAKLGLAAF